MEVEGGEIVFVELGPTRGREIDDKRRPVVVVSINDLNRKPLVVAVVPGTKAGVKPTHFKNVVLVPASPTNGLIEATIFQCHQLRALDHSRFTSSPVGRIEAEHLCAIEEAIRFSLGLV